MLESWLGDRNIDDRGSMKVNMIETDVLQGMMMAMSLHGD